MKIYEYGANPIIKRWQKKENEILFNDSTCVVSKVKSLFGIEMMLVELPLCRKVFCCDNYTKRGDLIIATTREDDYVSLIDTKTGHLQQAQRVETMRDMMIVTLQGGQRRFIDQQGKIGEAEIGTGGFLSEVDRATACMFKDENGNSCQGDRMFTDYNGRVRAGKPDIIGGLYNAYSHDKKTSVTYSFLGNEIDNTPAERRKYNLLYELYQSKIKLKDIPNEYLLDRRVYNFLVDEVNARLQRKANQVYSQDSEHFSKTSQEISRKLSNTLYELEERRNQALEYDVQQSLDKNTY